MREPHFTLTPDPGIPPRNNMVAAAHVADDLVVALARSSNGWGH